MATTIDQQPTINRATSVNGPIIFRLSATSTAGAKFRYVCRVKDSAGVEIVTLKAPPNAADEAVFDISLILRDYVKAALLNRLQTSAPVYTGAAANFPYTGYNPAAFFKVDLGSSEAADAASAPVTTYDHTDQKVNALIFPGDSGDENWLGSIYNKGVAVADYRPSTGGAGWLSDIPTSSYSGILGGTSIEQYCTIQDYRVCNFMYAANSTSGRDLGNEATVLKLSYYNTNTAANVNESYTLATELTVASTAITADRQMIAMAISGPKNWKTFGGLGIGAAISAGYVNTYEMRLEDGGGVAKSYTLVTHIVDVDCYNGNPMSLGWQNQAGGWDFFNFTQKRVKSTKSKRESFYKDAGTWQSSTTFKPWSDVEGGATTYIAENQRSIQLNTGWITDAESNLLESVFVSEAVFLLNPDNPEYSTNVKLTNMSYTQKLSKNDGLFKYTITIEYGKTRKKQMIQLVAYTQGVETPTELDLAAGSDVKLNYKFADPGKPLTRQSPHSQAFTLPFTADNNKFFGHWYNVNLSSGSFDSNVKTRAEIRNSGTIITEGFLQLRGVSLKAETYQVNVVGAAGELFSTLGDATLKDILASLTTGGAEDYEYAPTETNVINSWTLANDITAGSVGAGVVVVPLADYGNTPGGRMFWDYGVEDGLKLPNYLRGWHLKPSMQIKHIVEKLFVYAGFELSSSFLTSAPMDALYMLLGTSSKQALTRPFYGSKVGLTSDITVPGETTDDDPASFVQLTGWTDTGGDFYDPDNHMDSLGFTAPVDMEAAFEISLCFDNFTQNSWGYFYAIKNGETLAEATFNTIDQPDATTAWQFSFNVSLLAGENMSIYIQAVNSTPIEINNSLSTAWNKGTYLRFISYAATSGGEFIAVLDGLPQLKASDFLKELVNRFNLAVVADAEDDQTIIIEPMNNYLGTGTERDWTGKVDLDSNQQLTPMTQFRSKTNHFTDGVDKDYLNQWHSENFSMALGDYGFDSQDEFAQGDMTTPMLCGSTGMYPITTSNVSTNVQLNNITIPTYYGTNDAGESDIVTFKPKLLFYNELATLVNQSYYLGETLATTYPHFSPFTSKEIGASTWSVYWRHTFSFSTAVIGTEFAQGVYDRFWAQYMTDIYDPEARLLECEIVLSANDVRTLKFADIIRIKNEMYRVLDIGGYSPAQTSKTSVRLLKTLTNVKLLRPGNNDCELTYVSANVDGTTNWQDASGAAASPTAICCDSVGLYFSDSICWVQFPDTGGGGTKHDDNSAVPDYMPPVIIPGTTSPIKIPVPNTTDKLIANKSTALFPYANGQPTKQTSNTTGYALGAHQRYLMCATTSGLTTEIASPRGVLNSSGDGQPMMMIRTNMTTQIRVRCLGVDIASSDDTGISEYAFLEKLFIVQGSRARATELDSQTLDASKSAGRASPTITLAFTDTTDITGALTAVNVTITGGEADRITSWMIDVDMTLLDKSGTSTLRDAILCENGAQVLTENKAQLVTE